MSPVYNPDDWNKKFDLKLKYDPMNTSIVDKILIQYKHDEVLEYIKQLWDLIDYQRKTMAELNKQLVSARHKIAWNKYTKNQIENPQIVDKPKRSDTMGC